MLRQAVLILLVSVLLSACSSRLNEPISFFQVQTPRPFGYVIGDEIRQRVIIEVRQGLALQYSSIPNKGAINRWLNLHQVTVDKIKTNSGIRYQIDLVYQLFYAPLEVKMLEIPEFSLKFSQFGNSIEKKAPRWYFTMSPLRELAIRKVDGKEYMRADAPAPLLENRSAIIRLFICLLVAVILAVYLAWIYGLLTFLPKYQLFKRPARQLAKLSHHEFTKILNIMHGALNQLNGKPLFRHRMADFYQHFPEYQQLEDELSWFFTCSEQYFFCPDSSVNKHHADKIKALCRHCLQIERGKR